MKNKWLLCGLPLLVLDSLIADDCCRPCEPCRPVKCIEAVCYSPVYYNLQCDWGVSLSVDFLYWYGKESQFVWGLVNTFKNAALDGGTAEGLIVGTPEFQDFDVRWNPGVRVGLGFNACNGWSANLNWLYYTNDSSAQVNLGPATNFNQFVGGQLGFMLYSQSTVFGATTNDMKAKWDFDLNRLDLEFGNRFWITQCMTMRPYFGPSAYWSETKFSNSGSLDNIALLGSDRVLRSRNSDIKNENWGAGFLAGFDTNWSLGCGLSIFGKADVDLLWGEFKQGRRETQFDVQEFIDPVMPSRIKVDRSNSFDNNLFGMQTVLDLALGLSWEKKWCDCRYHTLFHLGWEHQMWFAHNRRAGVEEFSSARIVGADVDPTVGLPFVALLGEFPTINSDIMLGGFVARLRFDF